MTQMDNVSMMNPKEPVKYPYATILTYLKRKGQNSKNTRKTYERHIKHFFITMRGKELDELTEEDLIFTFDQIEAYQVALKERYKGATVNNTMTAIKECYAKLKKSGFDVSLDWFDLERYDEHDSASYSTLTHQEVLDIIELVSKTRAGKQKALLVRLAYATAFRKESLLGIKWSDIVSIDDVWFVKVLGKGNKWSHKKLSDNLYNALMERKKETTQDKVFTLTDKTVQKMMNYIRDNMDFGERTIVFHSFKNASINEVNIITGGDLKAMQQHGDHSDAKTTIESYVAKKTLEELVTVDVDTHIPVEKLDDLSHEELLKLVKDMDRNTLIKILRKGEML